MSNVRADGTKLLRSVPYLVAATRNLDASFNHFLPAAYGRCIIKIMKHLQGRE